MTGGRAMRIVVELLASVTLEHGDLQDPLTDSDIAELVESYSNWVDWDVLDIGEIKRYD